MSIVNAKSKIEPSPKAKSATVDIVGGKINNIIGTAIGGKASDISFNISVADWGNNDINTTWDAQ